MYTNIYIIDFEDSFTFNIASDLYSKFPNLKVVSHEEFFSSDFYFLDSFSSKKVIILGPGPGKPSDYLRYYSQIEKLLNDPLVFVFGICLGHQIIAELIGLKVSDANIKVHGEVITIKYKNKTLNVQRYNSLVPKSQNYLSEVLVIDGEVYCLESEKFVSFQFHPESIGTDNDFDFYSSIKEFLGK